MRPELVRIEDVEDVRNLAWAFWRAALGHRHCDDVKTFERELDLELAELARGVLDGTVRVGEYRQFTIHDPKERSIHAPAFRERVLHHALMRWIEPILDRSLVPDTFACRRAKGSHVAVHRVQQHLRRWDWLVKVDVRKYFDSVRHDVLMGILRRRVKGAAVLALCERIVPSYETSPGRGLPIGALTSQHFANTYLSQLDRYLLGHVRVTAMVRYMDDVLWWCADRQSCRDSLAAVRGFLADTLGLELKPSVQIRPSGAGVTFCGYRVRRGALLLGRRRCRRYAAARRRWEARYRGGAIGAVELQQGVASALAITAGADALSWRREELRRHPELDA